MQPPCRHSTRTGQLRALNLLADQHGVVVARVDYRYEPLTGLPIQRLVLRMDAQGQDLPLRSFLQAMLNAFPNLSIARLAYAKATDGSLKVDQALEIHLYYRWQAGEGGRMKLTISRPVQLALAITLVGTAVALLRPPRSNSRS